MDVLREEQAKSYEWTSRYAPFKFAYNTLDNKYIYEITSWLDIDTEYIVHKLTPTDSLDFLANKYYGRPDLFWVIADFNRIHDALAPLMPKYTALKIPAIATIRYQK